MKFRQESDLRQFVICRKIIEKKPNSELAEKFQFQIADIYLNDVKDYPFAIDEISKITIELPIRGVGKKGHIS